MNGPPHPVSWKQRGGLQRWPTGVCASKSGPLRSLPGRNGQAQIYIRSNTNDEENNEEKDSEEENNIQEKGR